MTIALRRASVAAAATLLLALTPAHAAGPLALFAKQIVQQLVRDFFESQVTSLVRESLGPCKSMLVDRARAGVPGMAGMGGIAGGLAGLPGGAAALPGAAAMDQHMRAEMQGMMAAMPQMQAMDPAMAAQMQQMLAGMQSAQPLSTSEVDELVDRMVVLAKAVPEVELPCSPAELKLVFNMSASAPMASGPLRMMLDQFRAMDQRFKEVEQTFAKMSSAEQAEAVDLMAADAASMSAEERTQLAAVLQSDLFGLPANVREQLRARLASLP